MHSQRRRMKQNGQYGNMDNRHLAYNGNQPMVLKEDAEPILYEGTFNLTEKGERVPHFSLINIIIHGYNKG